MLDVALDPASRPREGPAHGAGRSATLREATHTSSSCVLCSIPVQASASGSPGGEGAEGRGPLATVCVPLPRPGSSWGWGLRSLPPSGSSGLEARGADVRLVEGVGAVHHLGGRGRAGGQHRAQGLVAAQHRCEVLQLLRELFDLLPQRRVLFLQVFTLLRAERMDVAG